MTPDIIFNFATSGRSIAPIAVETANRRGLVDLIYKMKVEFNNLVFYGTYWEDEVKEARPPLRACQARLTN